MPYASKEIGYVTCTVEFVSNDWYPPWVQDENDADPDERSGSFTENR